ncbi:hypothetical protein SAMN05444422_102300 [Halobiforma haloterrestris]|uniref:Uncharacterized protein n=1 Tax=Natronobacterium haloterrestre TaxID=148448 RepID=A0A1I1EF48_NATHA|nr:hypothetical protein [Halobiforma haloterrestris]SFB83600.1 hypothetical protein SAMN05444422_102300 [Halobiforma haloterrestris]
MADSDYPGEDPRSTAFEPITDYESLRDRDDVAYQEETDVVDEAVVDQVADLADLAAVGITNPDGDLLCRRLTDTCSWKIPVATVGPDEEFAAAIVDHVRETIGFDVELESIETVLDVDLRTEDGEKTASRGFVTFAGTPASGNYDLEAATPSGDPVEEAGWFDELPEDADEIPGTEQFLE